MPDGLLAELSWELDPSPASAGQARRLLRALLDDTAHREWAEAAELAVSEVVTNVVLHAHTRIELRARLCEDVLWVEVRDHNPALPRERAHDTSATTGRGMALVAAVTRSYGVQSLGAAGKVVWFCVGPGQGPDADLLLADWDDAPTPGPGDAPDAPEPTSAAVTVQLRSLPPALWYAAGQHHDALLREMVLFRAEHPDQGAPPDLASTDAARSLVRTGVESALGVPTDLSPAVPAGVDRRERTRLPAEVDVQIAVAPDRAPAFVALQNALDDAERLARAGQLLVRPALPEILDVRDWLCNQVLTQLDGAPPVPWQTTDAVLVGDTVEHAGDDLLWDGTAVRTSSRGVVAADDRNRIVAVSSPLAAALGWTVEGLVGRRVVALVPQRLRAAHIAGFSRHLSTGQARILGKPVELPVLRADGSEVTCRVLLTAEPAGRGRAVYVAFMDPA